MDMNKIRQQIRKACEEDESKNPKWLTEYIMDLIKAHDRELIAAVRPAQTTETKSFGKDYAGYSRGYNAALADLDANAKKVLGE